MYFVTLSSIPPRFGLLEPTLLDLLAQRPRPEAVVLTLPRRYRRFPAWDGALPRLPPGILLHRVEEDLGPATKILPLAQSFAGQAVDLLYCDDDQSFRPDWAATFLRGRARQERAAIALSGYDLARLGLAGAAPQRRPRPRRTSKALDLGFHLQRLAQNLAYGGRSRVPAHAKPARRQFRRSGFVDVAEGYGGVLVRPDFFPPEAFRIPPLMWAVDDIWLSGQMARNGIPVWLEAAGPKFRVRAADGTEALSRAVIEGADRGQANRICAEYLRETYGIWRGRPGLP